MLILLIVSIVLSGHMDESFKVFPVSSEARHYHILTPTLFNSQLISKAFKNTPIPKAREQFGVYAFRGTKYTGSVSTSCVRGCSALSLQFKLQLALLFSFLLLLIPLSLLTLVLFVFVLVLLFLVPGPQVSGFPSAACL